MPGDMENHNSLSGRKRGITKHSVEDQALDQIAKEKIVGFGSGRSSPNELSADEDQSRPATPVEELVRKETRQSKKKRGRSRKHKKHGDDLTKAEPAEEEDPVVSHVIPDIFFEDLSETDKSKEENTSQDASSSDLSENIPEKNSCLECGEDSVSKDCPREGEVNFDDFWAEFDEIEGKPRKELVKPESFENNEEFGEKEISEEKKDDVSDEEKSISASNIRSSAEDTQGKKSQTSSLGDNDFWTDRDDESNFDRDRISEAEPGSKISEEAVEDSRENEEDLDAFWADFEDGVPKKIKEGSSEKTQGNECETSKSDIDKFSTVHDENKDSEASSVSSENPEQSLNRSRRESVDSSDSGSYVEKPKNTDEISKETDESLKENEEHGDDDGIDNIWEEEDLPPVFEGIKISVAEEHTEEDGLMGQTGDLQSLSDNDLDNTEPVESNLKPMGAEHEVEDTVNFASDQEAPDILDESPEENSASTVTDKVNESSEEEQEEREKLTEKEKSPQECVAEKEVLSTRNFAKAVQGLEEQPRRRSVIMPDCRERVEAPPTPPPLPRSPPPFPRSPPRSESSVDGRTRTRYVSDASAEDVHDDGIMDFLGKENDRAEARLAARRQARVEAREIRMKELERVQKEQEETNDKVFDLHCTTPPHLNNTRQPSMSPRERPTPTNSYHSSRRSSEDSMEDGLNLRDIRHELKEVEDKFRKAMIANAQLDNEKAAHAYQVELLKDRLEDLEEAHALLNREYKEKCREFESLKRIAQKLKEDLTVCKICLEERDRLISDYGLIIVGGEVDDRGETTPRALVSREAADVLEAVGGGSLDVRLRALSNEKNELVDEVRHLKLELEEERNRRRKEEAMSNGPLPDDVQQTLNDYRFRLQKAEQDTSTLQATVARLESQVLRYKSAAEQSEKAEEELKQEKRKLLRENRESIARIEELETANSHLQRRMDKLKNAKSTLLKEL